MKRTVISLVLTVLLVGSLFLSLPLNVSAESLYIRKIVSVVYDDSGSMLGDKWAYANYAMQAFCGMLNSEDQLYITYMKNSEKSGYTPETIDLSANKIQSSVDSIRNHTENGSTPYKAVEVAFDKLKSVKDSNPNTQYWLVVITDGSFDGWSASTAKNKLNDNLSTYAGTKMPNGTNPQITYLAIGGGAIAADSNESKGIYSYSTDKAEGIIDVMSKMADRVSGRTRLTKNEVKQVDKKTIQVSSSIPLLNIAVLAQGTGAKITEAVYSNETKLPISRSVTLSYPGYSDLNGGAFLVGDSQTVIGDGTYQIRFDREISLNDIVVLFEPALEMRMKVMLNGKEVTNHYDLRNAMAQDKISISCKIYEMGTNKEISPDLLPAGTEFEVRIAEGGKVVKTVSGKNMTLDSYELKNLETELTASVKIKGFNPIEYSVKFTPTVYVPRGVYTIKAEFGSDVKEIKKDDIASDHKLSILFTVYADGKAMTDPAEVKALNPKITLSPDGNDGDWEVNSKGQIVFTPNKAETKQLFGHYDVKVTCSLEDGTSLEETYRVKLKDYTLKVAFGSDIRGIKLDDIGSDHDLSIVFSLWADGKEITDPATVKALNPQIVVSPAGNEGKWEVTSDGKIVFVPNKATTEQTSGYYDVTVKCSIDSGAAVEESYRIMISEYRVIPVDTKDPIVKTEFFENKTSVSFYITKDGVKLNKNDLGDDFTIKLNEEHSKLKFKATISDDGIVTVTPYSEDDYELTFWTWFINWWHYFGLEGEDLTVKFIHSLGVAESVIDVRQESVLYILLNVVLPLVLEIALLSFLVWWIYCIFAKPKFSSTAVLYVGDLSYQGKRGARYHDITDMNIVELDAFNKLKYRWKPTLTSTIVPLDKGLEVAAGYNGALFIHCPVYYQGEITPKPALPEALDHPEVLRTRICDRMHVAIKVLNPNEADNVEQILALSSPQSDTYYVQCDLTQINTVDGVEVIQNATIFAYAERPN
ncbi:MAG: hypothetical protein J6R82_04340 [Clostridia bacterium]|nr:hypothetical protein [Clostridia bacterium]